MKESKSHTDRDPLCFSRGGKEEEEEDGGHDDDDEENDDEDDEDEDDAFCDWRSCPADLRTAAASAATPPLQQPHSAKSPGTPRSTTSSRRACTWSRRRLPTMDSAGLSLGADRVGHSFIN